MHYDAVTQTRRAIRNLQSEVRLFLSKNHEEMFPQINRKSNILSSRETPLTLRNSRQRSGLDSPYDFQTVDVKPNKTISLDQIDSGVNVSILKPRSHKKIKIVLPKFEKKQRVRFQSSSLKDSVQLMQHSLVQSNGVLSLRQHKQRKQDYKDLKTPKRLVKIPKIPRYNNKANLNKTNEVEKIEMPAQVEVEVGNRPQCFSPWEIGQDSQLIQISHIFGHS